MENSALTKAMRKKIFKTRCLIFAAGVIIGAASAMLIMPFMLTHTLKQILIYM